MFCQGGNYSHYISSWDFAQMHHFLRYFVGYLFSSSEVNVAGKQQSGSHSSSTCGLRAYEPCCFYIVLEGLLCGSMRPERTWRMVLDGLNEVHAQCAALPSLATAIGFCPRHPARRCPPSEGDERDRGARKWGNSP